MALVPDNRNLELIVEYRETKGRRVIFTIYTALVVTFATAIAWGVIAGLIAGDTETMSPVGIVGALTFLLLLVTIGVTMATWRERWLLDRQGDTLHAHFSSRILSKRRQYRVSEIVEFKISSVPRKKYQVLGQLRNGKLFDVNLFYGDEKGAVDCAKLLSTTLERPWSHDLPK